jgi:hypothetical protein
MITTEIKAYQAVLSACPCSRSGLSRSSVIGRRVVSPLYFLTQSAAYPSGKPLNWLLLFSSTDTALEPEAGRVAVRKFDPFALKGQLNLSNCCCPNFQ